MELPPGVDEAGSRPLQLLHALGQIAGEPKPVDSVSGGHPGPRVPIHKITMRDQVWQDIGSGMVARTFKQVSKLGTTSPGGPCMDDIFRRKVWSLSTGKVLDDCETDAISDDKLNRDIGKIDDIRVEHTLKNALKLVERKGPDVVEIFSQPRLCQEIAGRSFGGTILRPGFSLDLTMDDPATGQPWDLSKPAVQSRVIKLVRDVKPFCVVGSPPCTAFSPFQEISRVKHDPKVLAKELKDGKDHVKFCSEIYRIQIEG